MFSGGKQHGSGLLGAIIGIHQIALDSFPMSKKLL